MGLDIRLPIGLMFTIMGSLLVGYGFFTNADREMYRGALDINMNLWWGAVLLVFGLVMLALNYFDRAKDGGAAPTPPRQRE